jgi:hypothetical protein
MATTSSRSTSLNAFSTAHRSGVIATLGLTSHSPFICDDRRDGSVHFYLDGTVERSDTQKMAQAMPPLIKAPRPLRIEEECAIRY